MILTFAQGIARHATTTGNIGDPQNFLVSPSSEKVDINAPREQPLILSLAHRDTNYLLTIFKDGGTIQAWGYGGNNNGPMLPGNGSGTNSDEFYLYVDINRSTGEYTYGYHKEDFSAGTQPPNTIDPINRPDGSHWFNINLRTMNQWNANATPPSYGFYREFIRVFVAKYILGSGTFVSVSDNSPVFTGTQVGVVVGSSPAMGATGFRTGSLVYDVNGNAFKRSSNTGKDVFFTTEDLFTTQLPTSSRIRIESFTVDGLSTANMGAYTAVRFNDFNEIGPLTPALQTAGLFGIIEESVVTGQLTKVAIDGVLNNPNWNWDEVNQQIFVGTGGALQTLPAIPNQVPIAFALDRTTIVMRPARVVLTTGEEETIFPATTGQLGLVKVSVNPPGSPEADPTAVEINDPILVPGNTFAAASHNHDGLYYRETELDDDAGTAGAKVDKVVGTVDNMVKINAVGNLVDAGIDATDILTVTTANSTYLKLDTSNDPLTGSLRTDDGSEGQPGYAFDNGATTGMWYNSPDLSFSVGGDEKFKIESDGTLSVTEPSYTTLITNSNDIPNKAYVDSAASGQFWVQGIRDPNLTDVVSSDPSNSLKISKRGQSATYIAYGGSYPQTWDAGGTTVSMNEGDVATIRINNTVGSPPAATGDWVKLELAPLAAGDRYILAAEAGGIGNLFSDPPFQWTVGDIVEFTNGIGGNNPTISGNWERPHGTAISTLNDGTTASVTDDDSYRIGYVYTFSREASQWLTITGAPSFQNLPLPYDLVYFIGGTPVANAVVGSVAITRNVTVIKSLGSPAIDQLAVAYTETPASTVETVIEIYKNNHGGGSPTPVVAGTVTFPIGANEGVVRIFEDIFLQKGDRLKLVMASSTDLIIEDISVTLVGCAITGTCAL